MIKLEGATSVEYTYYGENRVGCLMNNFKITGVPSSNSKIILEIEGMKTPNSQNLFTDVNNIEISIEFRKC